MNEKFWENDPVENSKPTAPKKNFWEQDPVEASAQPAPPPVAQAPAEEPAPQPQGGASGVMGSSYPAYQMPNVDPVPAKTVWSPNVDNNFHAGLEDGEKVVLSTDGKNKLVGTWNKATGRFITGLDDKSRPITTTVPNYSAFTTSVPNYAKNVPMVRDQVTYPKVEIDPSQVKVFARGDGALATFRNTALRGLPSSLAGFAAFHAGGTAAAGAAAPVAGVLAEFPPISAAIEGGSYLTGGIAASMAASALADAAVNAVFPFDDQDEVNMATSPLAAKGAQLADMMVAMRPSAQVYKGLATGAPEAYATAAKGGVMNTAIGTAQELVDKAVHGQDITAEDTVAGIPGKFAEGALGMHKNTAVGDWLNKPGDALGAQIRARQEQARSENVSDVLTPLREAAKPKQSPLAEQINQDPVVAPGPVRDSQTANDRTAPVAEVPPRPERNGRDTSARDAWDDQYGETRRGGRTHNDDGTPYVASAAEKSQRSFWSKKRSIGELINKLGANSETLAADAVRWLTENGWIHDSATDTWSNPREPGKTALQALEDGFYDTPSKATKPAEPISRKVAANTAADLPQAAGEKAPLKQTPQHPDVVPPEGYPQPQPKPEKVTQALNPEAIPGSGFKDETLKETVDRYYELRKSASADLDAARARGDKVMAQLASDRMMDANRALDSILHSAAQRGIDTTELVYGKQPEPTAEELAQRRRENDTHWEDGRPKQTRQAKPEPKAEKPEEVKPSSLDDQFAHITEQFKRLAEAGPEKGTKQYSQLAKLKKRSAELKRMMDLSETNDDSLVVLRKKLADAEAASSREMTADEHAKNLDEIAYLERAIRVKEKRVSIGDGWEKSKENGRFYQYGDGTGTIVEVEEGFRVYSGEGRVKKSIGVADTLEQAKELFAKNGSNPDPAADAGRPKSELKPEEVEDDFDPAEDIPNPKEDPNDVSERERLFREDMEQNERQAKERNLAKSDQDLYKEKREKQKSEFKRASEKDIKKAKERLDKASAQLAAAEKSGSVKPAQVEKLRATVGKYKQELEYYTNPDHKTDADIHFEEAASLGLRPERNDDGDFTHTVQTSYFEPSGKYSINYQVDSKGAGKRWSVRDKDGNIVDTKGTLKEAADRAKELAGDVAKTAAENEPSKPSVEPGRKWKRLTAEELENESERLRDQMLHYEEHPLYKKSEKLRKQAYEAYKSGDNAKGDAIRKKYEETEAEAERLQDEHNKRIDDELESLVPVDVDVPGLPSEKKMRDDGFSDEEIASILKGKARIYLSRKLLASTKSDKKRASLRKHIDDSTKDLADRIKRYEDQRGAKPEYNDDGQLLNGDVVGYGDPVSSKKHRTIQEYLTRLGISRRPNGEWHSQETHQELLERNLRHHSVENEPGDHGFKVGDVVIGKAGDIGVVSHTDKNSFKVESIYSPGGKDGDWYAGFNRIKEDGSRYRYPKKRVNILDNPKIEPTDIAKAEGLFKPGDHPTPNISQDEIDLHDSRALMRGKLKALNELHETKDKANGEVRFAEFSWDVGIDTVKLKSSVDRYREEVAYYDQEIKRMQDEGRWRLKDTGPTEEQFGDAWEKNRMPEDVSNKILDITNRAESIEGKASRTKDKDKAAEMKAQAEKLRKTAEALKINKETGVEYHDGRGMEYGVDISDAGANPKPKPDSEPTAKNEPFSEILSEINGKIDEFRSIKNPEKWAVKELKRLEKQRSDLEEAAVAVKKNPEAFEKAADLYRKTSEDWNNSRSTNKSGEDLARHIHSMLDTGIDKEHISEWLFSGGHDITPGAGYLVGHAYDSYKPSKNREKIGDAQKSKAEKWADDTIKKKRKNLNSGLDPETLLAYAVKGAAHIGRGIREFGEWSKRMISEFGDAIKPHLRSIFDKANDPELHAEVTNRAEPEASGEKAGVEIKPDSKAGSESAEAELEINKAAADAAEGKDPEISAGGKVYRSIVDLPPIKFFKSVGTRLRAVADANPNSEAVQRIVDDFQLAAGKPGERRDFNTAVSNQRNIFANRLSAAMGRILTKTRFMNAAEKAEFGDLFVRAIEGRLPKDPEGWMGDTVREVRQVFDDMHQYATEAGVKMRKVKDYFPRMVDSDAVLADPKGFLASAEKAYRDQWDRLQEEAKEEAARKMAERWEKKENKKLEENDDYELPEMPDFRAIAEAEYEAPEKPNFAEMAQQWFDAIRIGSEGFEFERGIFDSRKHTKEEEFQKNREFNKSEAEHFDKFRDKDALSIMSRYVSQVVRRAEIARRLGANGEGWAKAKKDMYDQNVSAEHVNEIENLLRSNLGIDTGTMSQGKAVQTWMDGNNLVVTAAYLKATGLLNLVEPGAVGIRSNDILGVPRVMLQNLWRVRNVLTRKSAAETKAVRDEIERLYGKGHDLYSALALEMGITQYDHGLGSPGASLAYDDGWNASGKLRDATDAVHRMYLIHATEVAKRETSVREGAKFLDKTVDWFDGNSRLQKLTKLFGEKPDSTLAAERLEEVGVPAKDHEMFADFVRGLRDMTPAQKLEAITSNNAMAARYRDAVEIFSKQSAVQATRASRTVASNNHILGRLFFQLTTYPNEWAINHGKYLAQQARVTASSKYTYAERMNAVSSYGALAMLTAAYYGYGELRKAMNGAEDKKENPDATVPNWVRDWADAFMFTGISGPAEVAWKIIQREQLPSAILGDAAQRILKASKDPGSNSAQRAGSKALYRIGAVPALNAGLAVAGAAGGPAWATVAFLAGQAVANNRTEQAVGDVVAGDEGTPPREPPKPKQPPQPHPPRR